MIYFYPPTRTYKIKVCTMKWAESTVGHTSFEAYNSALSDARLEFEAKLEQVHFFSVFDQVMS